MHVFVLLAVCQQVLKIIQVSKQDKHLHNSSGYSKFKYSTEKRKNTLNRQQQNRKSVLGQINSDNSHGFSPTGHPLPLRMRSETSQGLKHLTRHRPRWLSWMHVRLVIRKLRARQHSFVEIDHEIFSTVILSLLLIQEGVLSVSGERMCTILVK